MRFLQKGRVIEVDLVEVLGDLARVVRFLRNDGVGELGTVNLALLGQVEVTMDGYDAVWPRYL
jgi:hypothetical protein